MKEILLVFYSEGMYDQAAYALRDYCNRNARDFEVVLAEENRYTNFKLAKLRLGFYKVTARSLPLLNRFSGNIRQKERWFKRDERRKSSKETNSDDNADTSESSRAFKAQFYCVDNVLMRFRPAAVLCLTPKSHKRVLNARQRLQMNMPVYAMMTDYCLNRNFLQEGTDGYLVQNKILAQALQNKDIPSEKIEIVGTPVESAKLTQYDRAETRAEFGIANDLPIITMMAGRYGGDVLKHCFEIMSGYCDRLNLVVMTGGSVSLVNYITNICKSKSIQDNVLLIDRVQDIAKVYSVTDVLLTAPTAAITYEAQARRIPFVVLGAMNAIEKGNLDYLTSYGVARRACTPDEIVSSVLNLLNNPDYYRLQIERLGEFTSDACEKTTRYLHDKMYEYRQQNPDEEGAFEPMTAYAQSDDATRQDSDEQGD